MLPRWLSVLLLGTLVSDIRSADPDYARDIRPILATACFKCHGPDEQTRKAKLRLDERNHAIRSAIVPGKPDESELIARIVSEDADLIMPPLSSKMILTASQRELFKRWIAAGAPYATHWSFVPPQRPTVPVVQGANHPIDAFVQGKIADRNLPPAPEADRITLIRRVSLDLIGLPPTAAEVEAFLADTAPDAYERLVDRLLASPRYGERWARRWLDLARYADTNGYEKDRPRSIWPYRDWVIRALNADMPFDQFTIEQLAGDLLPNATLDQRIATGFHRNTMLNEEGGIDPLEFRFHAMTDRVATTGTTWLGLTLGCAQCHTHKYDPISHREYYGVMAYLNNADEPEIELADSAIQAQRRAIESRIQEAITALPMHYGPNLDADFTNWLGQQREQAQRWQHLAPSRATSNLPYLAVEPDGAVFVSGDMSKSDTYQLTFEGLKTPIRSIRLEALPDERLPARGPGRTFYEGPKGEFFLSEFSLMVGEKKVSIAKAQTSFPAADQGAKMLDGDQQTGWGINGGQGQRHVAVFHLAEPFTGDRLNVQMLFERYYAAGLGRFRLSFSGAENTTPDDLPEEVVNLLHRADADLTADQRQRLRQEFLLRSPKLTAQRQSIDQLRKSLPAQPTTLVMRERPNANPRPTYLHHRGEFLQPKDAIPPMLPEALRTATAPSDRLGFARWLVSRENPLTARVTVNRHWAAFFGRGIVRTIEDFGIQGELPTHPELLDYLATTFMEEGWSVKRLHRLIVTSHTYRQSSRITRVHVRNDPDNRWLTRGPRLRLEAEILRDQILQVSGLMSDKIGGPSVFPPQPAGITTEGTYGRLDWRTSTGADRYRRSLYTFSKRTAPFAMFGTFDAPSGEACVARRDVSNTPLQALTLLNDTMFHEAANALGESIAALPGNDDARLQELFRRCLLRHPTDAERQALSRFVQQQQDRLRDGSWKPTQPAAVAVWASVARVLFNLDEMVTKN